MKPNFILLSFTKNNFTGNMFENQLKQKKKCIRSHKLHGLRPSGE